MTRPVAVFDRWWPYRLGVVVKRSKSSCWVRWTDGETWRYDRAHVKFLARVDGGAL